MMIVYILVEYDDSVQHSVHSVFLRWFVILSGMRLNRSHVSFIHELIKLSSN